MLRNARGMTLLEIMIVLAILGGLIGVLGQTVVKQFQKSKTKEAKIQISELKKSLDMFYTDCGFYPSSEVGLDALVSQGSGCDNWGPDPYIKKVPSDPWGNEYFYERDGSDFVITSLGADGRESGTGNDADISSDDF